MFSTQCCFSKPTIVLPHEKLSRAEKHGILPKRSDILLKKALGD
jgi:hypothetical protein